MVEISEHEKSEFCLRLRQMKFKYLVVAFRVLGFTRSYFPALSITGNL